MLTTLSIGLLAGHGVLEGIADGVARDRGLVGFGALFLPVTSLLVVTRMA